MPNGETRREARPPGAHGAERAGRQLAASIHTTRVTRAPHREAHNGNSGAGRGTDRPVETKIIAAAVRRQVTQALQLVDETP